MKYVFASHYQGDTTLAEKFASLKVNYFLNWVDATVK